VIYSLIGFSPNDQPEKNQGSMPAWARGHSLAGPQVIRQAAAAKKPPMEAGLLALYDAIKNCGGESAAQRAAEGK